jgi:hypothetical protein
MNWERHGGKDQPNLRHYQGVVICRSISRQRPKYANATIEKALQEVFSMWFAHAHC